MGLSDDGRGPVSDHGRRLDGDGKDVAGCEDCCALKDLSHATPRYRRALVIVVVLNLGMGIGEMVGGILGASQALKVERTPWPGLMVAAIVAELFLHSSKEILLNARQELRLPAAPRQAKHEGYSWLAA